MHCIVIPKDIFLLGTNSNVNIVERPSAKLSIVIRAANKMDIFQLYAIVMFSFLIFFFNFKDCSKWNV